MWHALAGCLAFAYSVRLVVPKKAMSPSKSIVIRDLQTIDDLKQVETVEREVWASADIDVLPLTVAIALKESGNIWIGAFDGVQLIGFAFGFLGLHHGRPNVHSHMLAVRSQYRNTDIGYKLKLAQRERVLATRVHDIRLDEITWTFDPLQSKNAHLNFAKLGVVSESYKPDFYGPETSSVLHRNSTDRLWVRWPIASRRVEDRLRGKDNRSVMLDALSTVLPLIQFNGEGKPARNSLTDALVRQRIVVEIPSDIGAIEEKDPDLAREWREATRWAFVEATGQGFLVAEFCRTIRGQQGPGAYILEKGNVEEYVPEMAGRAAGTR
jgi:predicted GNAT superfamily acetyltransferase